MSLIICPGIHHPRLTETFIKELLDQLQERGSAACQSETLLVFPTQDYPAYCAPEIFQFLQAHLGSGATLRQPEASLIFISFSAGVAGAIGAAWAWRQMGGRVKAFIALDGWGVPLYGDFPIYRLSHDYFTHWSSALLGGGEESFYASPPVEHLDLWRSPQTVQGWWFRKTGFGFEPPIPTNAALFLATLIERHDVLLPPVCEE